MTQPVIRRWMRVTVLLGMFVVGFFCGSIHQQPADAQWKDLGGSMRQTAGQSGGMLGTATDFGASIVEMQQHVHGLQKNLDTLIA